MPFNPFSALTSKIFGATALALLIASAFLWWRLGAKTAALTRATGTIAAQQAQIEALELDAKLKERASIERAADAAKNATQAQELNDARNYPGDDAATRRLRTLCGKLRQQDWTRFDATPACRRFAGQA
jgi:hypothetical protein